MNQTLGSSPRRWIVLVSYMLVTMICEVQWLAHASVSRAAAAFYLGQFNPASIFNVDFLAMLFLIAYLIFCLPASWLIDRFGLGIGVGTGAVLLIAGSVGKAIFSDNFAVTIVFQIVLAISQPFLVNGVTALTMRWFPQKERGTAAGLGVLAQYLGIAIALGVTPAFVVTDPGSPMYGSGLPDALTVYAIVALAGGIACLIFVRENPAYISEPGIASPLPDTAGRVDSSQDPIPASPQVVQSSLNLAGFFKDMGRILAIRDMRLTLILFFIGLGIVNTLTSMVDAVSATIGVRDSDGLIGVVLILGGIAGAVIMPILSDKFRKRKLFLIICAIGLVPGVTGLAVVKYFNPYHYDWTVTESPETVVIKRDTAHPSFVPATEGVYRFALKLSDAQNQVVENSTLSVLVDRAAQLSIRNDAAAKNDPRYAAYDLVMVPGQSMLLDASRADAGIVSTVYLIALISSGLLGFCLLAAGPLGFQYAAEVTHPLPEPSSQGLLMLAGQISGIVFTAGMSFNHNVAIDGFLIAFAFLAAVILIITLVIKESPMVAAMKKQD